MEWINKIKGIVPQFEILNNACVMPTREFVPKTKIFDGGVYHSNGQLCERAKHHKNGYKNQPSSNIDLPADADLLNGQYLYGGFLQNTHFGHFLVESLSRLWCLSHAQGIDGIVFVLRETRFSIPSFVEDILTRLFGDVKFIYVRQPTFVETLIVPDQLSHPRSGYIHGHAANQQVLKNLRVFDDSAPKKVYVSRSELSSNEGVFLGEKALESNLEKEGYCIVHPQKLSINEQIRIYTNAEKLIFADGSAFHLYVLVANSNQDIFVVWRRKAHEDFSQQSLTFIGKRVKGYPCLKGVYKEIDKPHIPVSHKALLDFENLADQLVSEGFITGKDWCAPTSDMLQVEIEEMATKQKKSFELLQTDLQGNVQQKAAT